MRLENLNPSVKAGTVLISVILLSFQYNVALNMTVFLFSILLLLIFSEARISSLAKILIPACIAAFGMFMMGLYYSKGNSLTSAEVSELSTLPYMVRATMSTNFYSALQLGSRILSYAGLGILFALSTDGEMFIRSLMHQCHLSPKFAYGILASFHLMPSMVREFGQARLALRTRGMNVGIFSLKPIFSMLVNSVRWSESLAMAMESKGFAGNESRTFYQVPHTHWYDWTFAAVCVGGIVLAMIFM